MELDPEKQVFVEAVMAPLGDDPALRELLAVALGNADTFPTREGDDVSSSTERMLQTKKSFKLRNRIVLAFSLLLAGAAIWSSVAGPPAWRSLNEIFLANRMMGLLSSMCCSYRTVPDFPYLGKKPSSRDDHQLTKAILARMSPAEGELLFGGCSKQDPADRWKEVWEAYPADPGHYLAYALSYRKEHSSWPPEFVETGERLDPGNGWFRLLAGADRARASVGVSEPGRFTKEQRLVAREKGAEMQRPPAPEKAVKEIIDPGALAESMRMLNEASAMDHFDDHRASLNAVRHGATPPVTDLATYSEGSCAVWGQPEDSLTDWTLLVSYRDVFALTLADAGKRGDREKLGEIQDAVIRLSGKLLGASSSVTPRLVVKTMVSVPSKSLGQAWTDAGEPEKGKEFEAVAWNLNLKSIPTSKSPDDALDEYRGSGALAELFLGNRGPGSRPVAEEEVRGGRLAEYSLYERFMLHVAAMLLAVTMFYLMVSAVISRRKFGLLPDRLAGLLTIGDHVRIFLWGVLVPAGIYALATRTEWLSPRGFTLGEDRFFIWLIQAATFAALVILWTIQASRRCLAKRGRILVLGWPGSNPGIWLTALAVTGMMAGPRLLEAMPDETFFKKALWAALGAMAALPWLWIVVLASGQVASAERSLHRATLVRTIAPFIAAAMALLAVSIPAVYAAERHWVSHMDFDALRPQTNIFFPRTELEHADWVGGEIRKSLDDLAILPAD